MEDKGLWLRLWGAPTKGLAQKAQRPFVFAPSLFKAFLWGRPGRDPPAGNTLHKKRTHLV